MSGTDYIKHYFDYSKAIPFFLISLCGLVLVMGVILVIARIREALDEQHPEESIDEADFRIEEARASGSRAGYVRGSRSGSREAEDDLDAYEEPFQAGSRRSRRMDIRPLQFVERFYEMAFASTSVLLILSLYYIIGDRVSLRKVNELWNSYKDWILILFLLVSMLLNRFLDRVLVPLRHITAKQRASIRLVSAIYIVLILLYIRFIYNSPNYDNLILYFVTLVIGRFLYFDVTWEGFKSDMSGIFNNFPYLCLMAAYSALVVWYGFHSGFLLKSNGVLVSTLIAHLFMDAAIFIIDKTRILHFIL